MKELQIRAGRIGLPYPGTTDPDAVYWVREDEIRQIQRLGQGCIVVLSSPVRSIETSDGTRVMHFYHKTIGATVDEVLSACEKVRTGMWAIAVDKPTQFATPRDIELHHQLRNWLATVSAPNRSDKDSNQ